MVYKLNFENTLLTMALYLVFFEYLNIVKMLNIYSRWALAYQILFEYLSELIDYVFYLYYTLYSLY